MFQKLYVPEILGVGVRVGVGRLGVGALAGGVAAGVAVGEVEGVLNVANHSCRGGGGRSAFPMRRLGCSCSLLFLFLVLNLYIGCCRLEGGVCVTTGHFMEHFSR